MNRHYWTEENRKLAGTAAIMRRWVYRRFDERAVRVYDSMTRNRPETLALHVDFESYCEPGATFRATSLATATTVAHQTERRPFKGTGDCLLGVTELTRLAHQRRWFNSVELPRKRNDPDLVCRGR
jgi:hypothetical protein